MRRPPDFPGGRAIGNKKNHEALMAVGGIIGGAFALGAAALSAKATRDLAREQMAFQKMMYENRHRMTVTDLRAAGLNPILSAMYGAAGGSVPPGSARDINIPDPTPSIAQGSSAQNQLALTKEEIKYKRELGKTEQEKRHLMAQQSGQAVSASAQMKMSTALDATRMPGALKSMKIDQSKAGTAFKFLDKASTIVPFTNSARGALR